MAKIRKCRIHWKPSNSHGLKGYRLYWDVDGDVHYDSEHVDVGSRTEIVLPDDIPSLPVTNGDMQIGITAVTDRGNESDMVKMSSPFDFVVPDPPSEIQSEDLEDYFLSGPAETEPVVSEIEEPGQDEWRQERSSSDWNA